MAHFNLTYDLEITLEQRLGFEMAAQIWSQFLTDDTQINLHISATSDLNNGQAVGGAVPIFHEVNYGVYQEYLALDATSEEDSSVLDALQEGNTVDFLVDGELVDGNTTIMLTRAQAKALGMDEALTLENGNTWTHDVLHDPNALDGYVVINNSYDWNYDFTREGEMPEGELDFLTMALHELGHSLGFVSGLDGLMETFELHSGETRAEGFTALDLLRYSDTSVTIENPDGSVSDLSFGGAAYFSLNGGVTELAEFEEGDEYQASHWQRFQNAIGVMDPTLGYRERTDLSHLDLQAFDVLGWDVDYASLQAGLDLNALYDQAMQAVSQDFGLGVTDMEGAIENGQDWRTLARGAWWEALKDQIIELGHGGWWQQFEAQMAQLSPGGWWQSLDQQMLELGPGSWWQLFEDQVLALGHGGWWQEFEADMLDLSPGGWWQVFEPQMVEMSFGGWWQVFEQQMLALGHGGWWQEFEAQLLELGHGSWWQAFGDEVLALGPGSWWQLFEDKVLELGHGGWWQEFEASMLELSPGGWWQAFELSPGGWWQVIETHLANLAELETTSSEAVGVGETTTITGGAADDILAGDAGSDLISGDAGDDLMDGKAGNDILLGDAGHDIVYGWDGEDVLYGGAGDDLLAGENGNDRLYGEAGHDILSGGRGHDILEGGDGRDVLKGDTDNDVLKGGADVDDLSGGSGEDILIGGEGEDSLSGDKGDDQLYGDVYNSMFYEHGQYSTDTSTTQSSNASSNNSSTPSSNTSPDAPPDASEDLLSTLGVTTDSNLLDLWIRLEAEDMQLTSYNADDQADASNGGVISTSSSFWANFFTSKAQTTFNGPTGAYQLVVGYYDDNANDSEATLQIKRENNSDDDNSWWNWWSSYEVEEEHSWSLDQGVGVASTSNNFFTYVIDDVNLESGDRIELIGDSAGNEQVRIDYLDIIAVNPDDQIASDGADKLAETAFYNGNFYAVADSTATAAAEAANRGGELISAEAGSQLAIWLQNTFETTANIIEIKGEADAVNLVTSHEASQSGPIRIEAEDLTFTSGYSIEDEDEYDVSASGDSLLKSTRTGTPSSAQFTIETTGIYNLYANYFDSEEGVAQATVFLNGTVLNSWQFNQDDDQMHSRILGMDVVLTAGDVLELQSLANDDDEAAVDYFTLEQSSEQDLSSLMAEENTVTSYRFEAEAMDLSASAQYANRYESAASGAYAVYTTNTTDGLTATTNFTGATGLYDILVGYFDDDSSSAHYSATLGGVLLDSWQSTLELEDYNTGSNNFVTRTVARAVAVNAGDNITLQSIREGYDYGYLDYVEFVAHDPTAPIRMEAEYMSLSGSSDLYTSNISSVASTGRAIRSTSSSSSNTVEGVTTFTGASGVYDIVVAYFDENDGQAQFTLNQGTTQLDSWIADQNLGSSSINATTYTTRTLSGISLTHGDEISFTSLRQGYDYGAIDYIEFQPFIPNSESSSDTGSTSDTGSASNTGVTFNLEVGTTYKLEVESMNLTDKSSIVEENFASANRFVEASDTEIGFTATTLFSGETGYYDIVLAYYDSNKGDAELAVKVDHQELDRWYADENLGSDIPETQTFTTRTVASGVYVSQTDLIEITGIEDNGDKANIDYIQFIAVEDPTPPPPPPPPVLTDPEGGNEDTPIVSNADILRGGAGNDFLDGGLGDDILYGEDEIDAHQAGGNDTIYGGSGNDYLFGNSGDDILYGDFVGATGETLTIFESSFEAATSTGHVAAPLEGWESTDGFIEIWTSQSADGNNHIELNEDPLNHYQDSSQISRQIETVAGENYTLTFQYSPRNGFNASVNAMEVRLGGETLLAIAEDGTNASGLNWNTYTVSFTGDGSTQILEFISTGQAVNYGRGAHLDDIKLIAEAPAPAATTTEGNDNLTGGSGHDTLYGGAGDDILNGTDSVAVGLNEQDALRGGSGADQFILGDFNAAFYSAGGNLDYATIQDFTAGIDIMQLHGSVADYTQSVQGSDLLLFYGESQDLVAQFNGVTSELTLNEHALFVGDAQAGLVAHWSFDETSGGAAQDAVGAHTGTLTNTPTDNSQWDQGRIGGALTLDGVNDYVAVADSSDINLGAHGQHTVSVWFKVDDAAITSRKQVIYEQGGTTRGLSLYVHNDRLYAGGWNKSVSQSNWQGTFLQTDQIVSGQWHHVALTLDGDSQLQDGALTAYLDGQQFGVGAGSQLWQHSADTGLGNVNGDTVFHDSSISGTGGHALGGSLDEARIYNRALSADEVDALYGLALTADNDPLTGVNTLSGGAGADQFILGDANTAYYSTDGSLDYVVIQDFTAGIDTIQLHGSASDYQQSSQAGDLFLYYGTNQDLVAQLVGVTAFDLNSDVAFI